MSTLVDSLLTATASITGRPKIVAVDGRSAAGKTTLATLITTQVSNSAIIHTDDVAWQESFFGWDQLMSNHVLEPLHRGSAVSYRPPAWERAGRPGWIEVDAGLDLVIVEGVGAGRRELDHLLDQTVWVQSDFHLAERRGIERDIASGVNGDRQSTEAFWHEWMSAELLFFSQDKPWERAWLTVNGTPAEHLEPHMIEVSVRR